MQCVFEYVTRCNMMYYHFKNTCTNARSCMPPHVLYDHCPILPPSYDLCTLFLFPQDFAIDLTCKSPGVARVFPNISLSLMIEDNIYNNLYHDLYFFRNCTTNSSTNLSKWSSQASGLTQTDHIWSTQMHFSLCRAADLSRKPYQTCENFLTFAITLLPHSEP